MKRLKIAVLVKQVVDTYSVGVTALKSDGTVNRDQLPAIINPDDLNALELAFKLRDCVKDSSVSVISMGPPRAVESIQEAIWRGADRGFLLSDRKFAGADTLSTSYALSKAIKKIKADVVFCGSQSIDGDTGHVGPQTAQQLGIPQITYTQNIECIEGTDGNIIIRATRLTDSGSEMVQVPVPVLFTVTRSACQCRPKNVRRMIEYRNRGIEFFSADDINAEPDSIGLEGSPTRVIDSVRFVNSERHNVVISSSADGIDSLFETLRIKNYID